MTEPTIHEVVGEDEDYVRTHLKCVVRIPGTHVVRHEPVGANTLRGQRLAAAARRAAKDSPTLRVAVRNNSGHLLITVTGR